MDHSLIWPLSRRSLIQGALAATQIPVRLPATQATKLNVIVILFDDLGVADQGYWGASDLKTPNIDRVARSAATGIPTLQYAHRRARV